MDLLLPPHRWACRRNAAVSMRSSSSPSLTAGCGLGVAQATDRKTTKRLNGVSGMSIKGNVNGFKTVLTLLLLATWFPCTAHCEVEASRLLKCVSLSDPCCAHTNTSSEIGGCQVCDWVSSGAYKTQNSRIMAPESVPASLFTFFAVPSFAETVPTRQEAYPKLTAAPPDLLNVFQFVSRTALPARAPSLVS